MMERQRHAKDIAHPMYDTIDNASSAAVDCYYTLQCLKVNRLVRTVSQLELAADFSIIIF